MKLVSDENRRDDGIDYRHTVWEHAGRTLEVNTDEFGHHARVDKNPFSTACNLSDMGLIKFVLHWFGGRS